MDLERILVIEEGYLYSEQGSLKNKRDSGTKSVAWVDVAALMIEGHGVSLSLGVIQECADRGISVVLASKDYYPAAFLSGPAQHIMHRRLLLEQMTRDHSSIWSSIISNKIRNQLCCMVELGTPKESAPAKQMERLSTVYGSENTQREALAAKIYWENMYSGKFKRIKKGAEDNVNARLNFGYTILRSYLSRYITLAGLHPGIGINHRNQRNPFCLSDDLIEPFRPAVDYLVAGVDLSEPFGKPETKKEMLSILDSSGIYNGKSYSMSSLLRQYVLDLSNIFKGEKENLGQVNLVF